MRVLGCDIGTSDTKLVVLEDGEYVCGAHGATEASPDRAFELVVDKIRQKTGLGTSFEKDIVVTGWGESRLSRPHRGVSQISCMRKAALWKEPSCRTVLELGAQQSIAVSLNQRGGVLQYKVSDKCASGAGKFLEIIVEALGCTVDELSTLAREAEKEMTISSQCAVFAESEVVSLMNDSVSVADIAEGLLQSLSKNITGLSRQVRPKETIVLGGGLAKSERLVELIRQSMPRVRVFEPEPSYMVAVGAALHGT